MSRQVILILAFSCCFIVQARTQNLVPNPSFEIISSCPNNLDQLYLADSWFDPSFCTPDLFNTCNALLAPQNAFGWQQARTGNGYAGIGVYAFFYPSSNINIREFLEVKLNDTLKAGARYCIEFYASLGDSSFWQVNRLQLVLSNNVLNPNCSPYNSNIALEHDSAYFFSNTQDWVLISGVYTAIGGEEYLTIGNFLNDSLTDTSSHNGPNVISYFYIDDVSVTECPEPPPLVSSLIVPNAFSPNGDGINDFFSPSDTNLSFYTCKIYNRWGNLVFETTNPNQFWDGNYNGGDCVDGTYFYLIESVGLDDKKYLFKGFLMLAR
jgi:gliding motility-associated-like protein